MRSIKNRQLGFSLLEVIITMAILAVGLLGLAGLQARAINAEVESFSRGQAMMLATEMADRMSANLAAVSTSTTANTGYNQQDGGGVKVEFGTGYTGSICSSPSTVAAIDLCDWNLALQGSGELTGSNKVGGMKNARGCVFYTGANNEFQIDVVWQGRDIGVVGSDNTCGSAAITSRRSGVSRIIRLAELDGT